MSNAVKFGFLTAALMSLFIVACTGPESVVPQKGSIEPGTTLVIPETEWRIVTQQELDRLYRSNGMELNEGSEIAGFTGIAEDGTIVVYTTPPRRVDGDETTTLGHEIMHNVLGQYHR